MRLCAWLSTLSEKDSLLDGRADTQTHRVVGKGQHTGTIGGMQKKQGRINFDYLEENE